MEEISEPLSHRSSSSQVSGSFETDLAINGQENKTDRRRMKRDIIEI